MADVVGSSNLDQRLLTTTAFTFLNSRAPIVHNGHQDITVRCQRNNIINTVTSSMHYKPPTLIIVTAVQ